MTPVRCSRCFRRVDFIEAHVCATQRPEPPKREPRTEATYSRPSRTRVPRADYLASVAAPHGSRKCGQRGCDHPECREARNAYMRAWRAARKAKAS